jgi:hypothetical protein
LKPQFKKSAPAYYGVLSWDWRHLPCYSAPGTFSSRNSKFAHIAARPAQTDCGTPHATPSVSCEGNGFFKTLVDLQYNQTSHLIGARITGACMTKARRSAIIRTFALRGHMIADTQTEAAAHRPKKWILWTGRILSALPILMMLLSASMKFMRPPEVVDSFVHKFGYPESELLILGIVELACALLYAIPRTAFLGAILVTGYFGGAIATQVRIGDPTFVGPLLLGIFAWAGLYLRDDRLHALMPLRQTRLRQTT